MILTAKQLHRITGLTRASGQVAWLRARGWKFELDHYGKPIVARAEMEARLVSNKPSTPQSGIRWDRVGHGSKAQAQ